MKKHTDPLERHDVDIIQNEGHRNGERGDHFGNIKVCETESFCAAAGPWLG